MSRAEAPRDGHEGRQSTQRQIAAKRHGKEFEHEGSEGNEEGTGAGPGGPGPMPEEGVASPETRFKGSDPSSGNGVAAGAPVDAVGLCDSVSSSGAGGERPGVFASLREAGSRIPILRMRIVDVLYPCFDTPDSVRSGGSGLLSCMRTVPEIVTLCLSPWITGAGGP